MTYISAQVTPNRQQVIVWERDQNGDRDYRMYTAPWYFYHQEKGGEYKDIHGKDLTRMDFKNYRDFRDSKDLFKRENIQLYESDISPEYKILSKHYYNKPIGRLNTTFIDIEVDKDPKKGYATFDDPYAPIISVALYHQYNDRFVIYAIPPDKSWTLDKIPQELYDLAEVVLCKDEKQLLKYLLAEIENTDIISGWNSSVFDLPYIYIRLQNELGSSYSKQLSFANAREPKVDEIEIFKVKHKVVRLYGRIELDYLRLFRKLEQHQRPSYALEAVSEELLPNMSKLTYEGQLHDLYRNDFIFFLRYNIRDVEILKEFEKKLKYANFAVQFSHLATGMVDNILGTIKLTDTAFINVCHYERNKICPDTKTDENKVKFAGAFVLTPQIGKHKYIGGIDVEGLYPSTIMTLNISPETIIGQFLEKTDAYDAFKPRKDKKLVLYYENGFSESYTVKEWVEIFKKNNWNVSGYGTVYTQQFKGIIPSIVEDWKNKRKDYKNEMKRLDKQIKITVDPETKTKLEEEKDNFDKLQYVMKIRNNSVYGCLGNAFFRFYDLRNAESVTRSGREILMHMNRFIAEQLDGEYTYPSPSILYGDTDSSYMGLGAESLDEAIVVADIVTNKVNNSFPTFISEAFFVNDDFNKNIRVECEAIFDTGIFVKKKLYVLHVAYKGGKKVDEMKVMGLQLKKTTIPKPIGKQLIKYVEEILKDRPWKDIGRDIVAYKDVLLKEDDITLIGLPKGVKKVEEYTENYNADGDTTLPGGNAASIYWNTCLDQYEDVTSAKISSGMKIKVYYLKKSFGRFKSIALPSDMKKPPKWFMDDYYHLIDREAQVQRLVDMPLKNIIKAIGERMPTKKSLAMDDLFEY